MVAFTELQTARLKPNAETYKLLIQAFSIAGRTEDGERMVRESGVKLTDAQYNVSRWAANRSYVAVLHYVTEKPSAKKTLIDCTGLRIFQLANDGVPVVDLRLDPFLLQTIGYQLPYP